MIAPAPGAAALLLLVAAGLALLALAGVSVPLEWLLLGLAVPLGIDLGLTCRLPRPEVSCALPETAMLRRSLEARLSVRGARLAAVAIDWPVALGGPLPPLPAPAGGEVLVSAVPRRRGSFGLGEIWVSCHGPLRLWRRRFVVGTAARVHVLPDLRGPGDDALASELFRAERDVPGALAGGGELLALRPFQGGDERRHVDWKATARLGTPVVRQWQPERQRSLLVAIDAGRLMRSEHDGETKLDAAVRALGRLALSAETLGDQVGALIYADELVREVASQPGRGQASRLLRQVSDLEPALVESDLGRVVPLLLQRHRRSLLVVITDVTGTEAARSLAGALLALGRVHLPVVILLRDPHLDEALERVVTAPEDAYARAAAELLYGQRRAAIACLSAHGQRVLDVSTRSLALAAVRGYREGRQLA